MAQLVQDIMTKQVHTVRSDASVIEVAKMMRDKRIGDVLVNHPDGTLCGIVTDRDIVIRVVADNKAADRTKVGDICSQKIVKLAPTDSIDQAVKVMRDNAIRRVPVMANSHVVGIVSIGDLARVKDPNSALAQISSAAPNN